MTIKGRPVSNGYCWMDFVTYFIGALCIFLMSIQIYNLKETIALQDAIIAENQTQIIQSIQLVEKSIKALVNQRDAQIVIDKSLLKIMKKSNPKLTAKEQHEYIVAITENAKRTGISPILIGSIIHRETNFRKDLISSVGALGPMQTLPEHSKRLGIKENDMKTISGGVKAGTTILKEYLDNNNGNYRAALNNYVGVKKNFYIGAKYTSDIFQMAIYAMK